MVEANPRLIQDYEAIRHREYDLITSLLDVLPKIDNLDDERISQVRDAMFHADHPFLMVFVGPFSSGKSSIINALLGDADLLRIGPVPTTDRISILRWGDEAQQMGSAGDYDTVFYPAPMLKKVSLVDTPGLESVFKQHEDTTRRFLHRADVVLLVMLATQAMTQSNLRYLQTFKEYGKKVILVINQVDLLSDEEAETVKQYVLAQSRDKLGLEPPIWMVSARKGIHAHEHDPMDTDLWRASGMWHFEDYIERQLGDADRLRQKLQTPLQIVQSAHQVALTTVRRNQETFDNYRSIKDNIDQQLASQRRGQAAVVRDATDEIARRFSETADRSGAALRDIFQFSRALGSFIRGVVELIGLARFFQRTDRPSYIHATFERFKVFEPIEGLTDVVDKLGSRLEGRDMQDIDDLVRYGEREIKALPAELRNKVIGNIQAPVKYDRSAIQSTHEELERIEDEARVVETENLEQIRRNTLLYLAIWELIMVVLLIALVAAWGLFTTEVPVQIILLIVLLGASLLGFALIPLRGRVIHTRYANRLHKLQSQYTEILTHAADRQIEYGMQLRRDAIAPLARLVEAQAAIQDEQMTSLRRAEQDIVQIETELNALGKRRVLGFKL